MAVAAAAASTAAAAAATPKSPFLKQPAAVRARDVELLTEALFLERRTVAAYVAGIPLLAHPQAQAAEQYLSEELSHTGELIWLIESVGGKAQPRPNSFDLGHPRTAGEMLALLHSLESALIAYYLRVIPQLSPGPIRAAVASILTVDAQHVTMLRLQQGQTPVPSAFVTGAQ